MRVVVFFVALFTFLLCGGHYLHADTPHHAKHCPSNQRLAKSEGPKLRGAGQDLNVIEEADLDLDEEHLSSDELPVKNLHQEYYLLNRWYLTFYSLIIADADHQHYQPFLPFSGNSSPIYIRQRVLRI
ncbi:hypothetical protein QG516_00560 [Pedobacter gandavensis]|uniref:hypothetical protein n=1 Tax=Pedobacter TaxID=84567 RepID=UPI001C99B8F1|nr:MULTISPECIES: hypothetical protein [Pedobacter]WGQ10145.1 hypothetical protein QG516_00560 [Pedobacter gandavensis]